jgi:hypothetical protein
VFCSINFDNFICPPKTSGTSSFFQTFPYSHPSSHFLTSVTIILLVLGFHINGTMYITYYIYFLTNFFCLAYSLKFSRILISIIGSPLLLSVIPSYDYSTICLPILPFSLYSFHCSIVHMCHISYYFCPTYFDLGCCQCVANNAKIIVCQYLSTYNIMYKK